MKARRICQMSDDSDEVLAVSLISVRRVEDFRQSVRDRKAYLGVSWRKLRDRLGRVSRDIRNTKYVHFMFLMRVTAATISWQLPLMRSARCEEVCLRLAGV